MALRVGLKVEALFDDDINWYPAVIGIINADGTLGVK